jgi:hypothetical protein
LVSFMMRKCSLKMTSNNKSAFACQRVINSILGNDAKQAYLFEHLPCLPLYSV